MQIRKNLKKIGIIFIALGAIGLLLPFMSAALTAKDRFQQEVGDLAYSQSIYALDSQHSGIPTPRPDYELKNVKNRLTIETADVDMPIFSGDSEKILNKGGWIFPNTPTPDQGGNTVIFGHRFRYLPPISNTFFHLDRVKINDEFHLVWEGVTYKYTVREIKIIEPTDFSVLEKTAQSRLTLITCTPIFSTKQRLVVIAELSK